jgi:hypothetical protein
MLSRMLREARHVNDPQGGFACQQVLEAFTSGFIIHDCDFAWRDDVYRCCGFVARGSTRDFRVRAAAEPHRRPSHHHHNKLNPPFSTRDISTTMTAIQKAIAAINSQDAKGQLSYRAAAKTFGVNRTTLSRHHRGIQTTNAGAH